MRLLEVKQPNIIVVYGGGFQPFHEGHASSYREAKAAFPGAYFFVAASNVTTERPFEFKEKQFLAQQAGVVDPFIQVGTMSYVNDNGRKVTSTPLNPLEALQQFNPEKDILIIVRSERDPMKSTDTSYFQPWTDPQTAESFSKHAYVFVTKKHDFSIAGKAVYSGSQVRELYSGANDKTKIDPKTGLPYDTVGAMRDKLPNADTTTNSNTSSPKFDTDASRFSKYGISKAQQDADLKKLGINEDFIKKIVGKQLRSL